MRLFLFISALFVSLTAKAASTVITNVGSTSVQTSITNSVTRGLVVSLDANQIDWTGSAATNINKTGYGLNAGLINASKDTCSVPGQRGSAFNFPASNDYLQCGRSTTVDDMTNGMTLCYWLRVPAFSGTTYVHAKGASAGRKLGFLSSAVYPFRFSWLVDCATTDYTEVFNGAFRSNTWYHVAVLWNGSLTSNSTSLYINGQPMYSTSVTAGAGNIVADNSNNQTFGGYNGDGTFNGQMDEIKVFTNLLTAAEIAAIYSEGRTIFGLADWTTAITATNLLLLDGLTAGTNYNVGIQTNWTVGYAAAQLTGASFSAASGSNYWTVEPIGEFGFSAPITVNGTTYSSTTNALAYYAGSTTSAGWLYGIPPSWGNITIQYYWKTTTSYNGATAGNGHDISSIQAPSQDSVAVYWHQYRDEIGGHTVSNATSYLSSGKALGLPNVWYRVVHSWDTNNGLAHFWWLTTTNWPVKAEQNQIISYSVAPLPVGTNAVSAGPFDNPHAAVNVGRTNYTTGFAITRGRADLWGFTLKTNYP